MMKRMVIVENIQIQYKARNNRTIVRVFPLDVPMKRGTELTVTVMACV